MSHISVWPVPGSGGGVVLPPSPDGQSSAQVATKLSLVGRLPGTSSQHTDITDLMDHNQETEQRAVRLGGADRRCRMYHREHT